MGVGKRRERRERRERRGALGERSVLDCGREVRECSAVVRGWRAGQGSGGAAAKGGEGRGMVELKFGAINETRETCNLKFEV